MNYCRRCTYPSIAVNLEVDNEGICTSCRTFEQFEAIDEQIWNKRREKLGSLIKQIIGENKSNYDCIVPVSGGKDSYFQTHAMIEEFGLKPLLVTYHGNNYLPEGDYNRDRMRHVFDADHLVFGPSVEVLKKLNRICFKKMGDMNWHAHCGISTYPIQIAVKFKIPLIMWGEIAWDISGMYDPDDYVEFSARVRHEHSLRGYEWDDMLKDPHDLLTEKDLLWAKYPQDQEILDTGVRGLYLGNFLKWDPNLNTKLMQEKYGWKAAEQPFERTYRSISNLDDRYENGAHDLLKFIKFGFGRASDHTAKDIRQGFLTRQQGVELVKKHDHIVSQDLYYWLNYVNMSEDEFWSIADTFRDPRVWWIEDGKWYKDNIWGEPSSYGEVNLSTEKRNKYTRIRETS
jgi:N-acetyl sugar amidotransferase